MNEPQKYSGDINKNDEVKTFKYLLLIKNKPTKKGKNCPNQLVQNSGNYSETCNNLGSIYSKKITWLSEEAVSIVEQSHYQTLLPICAVALKSNRKKRQHCQHWKRKNSLRNPQRLHSLIIVIFVFSIHMKVPLKLLLTVSLFLASPSKHLHNGSTRRMGERKGGWKNI